MAIKIKGVIGYDVNGQKFADKISKLSGDIEFEIDSPGGSVFHGISIYNAIKNYDRGKCKMHVVGQASSMAGYIMMAGDGLPTFEPNAVCVLHNPWTIAMGDYKVFQKEANILERLSALYAEVFVKKGVFKEAEIRSIMDAETWFIGSKELSKLGTVNESSEGDSNNDSGDGDETDREITIAACKERMQEANAKIRELECSGELLDKIAALIPSDNGKPKQEQRAKQEIITTKKGERKMENLAELKAEKPNLYSEARGEGVKAEQDRVKRLMAFMEQDKEAVMDAIINGKDVTDPDFQAKLLQTRLNNGVISAMQQGNPPSVDPKAEVHAPEQKPEGEGEGNDEGEPKQTEEQKKEAEAASLEKVLLGMGFSEAEAKAEARKKAGL